MAKQDIKELELFSIEELKVKKAVKESIFHGLKALKGWSSGKMVTEKEFLEALDEFLKSPMKGQGDEKDVERC